MVIVTHSTTMTCPPPSFSVTYRATSIRRRVSTNLALPNGSGPVSIGMGHHTIAMPHRMTIAPVVTFEVTGVVVLWFDGALKQT